MTNYIPHRTMGKITYPWPYIYKINHVIKSLTMSINRPWISHYGDVTMGAITSQITSLMIVYSTVYSGADQSKHQSSASLAFVWEIHRGPVNFPHKWPVTRKMFPFDDVIIYWIMFYVVFFSKRFQRPSVSPTVYLNVGNIIRIYRTHLQ